MDNPRMAPRLQGLRHKMESCENCGCFERINSLEKADEAQWGRIGKMEDRQNAILTRINVILGGVAVACVLLAVNLFLGK